LSLLRIADFELRIEQLKKRQAQTQRCALLLLLLLLLKSAIRNPQSAIE